MEAPVMRGSTKSETMDIKQEVDSRNISEC